MRREQIPNALTLVRLVLAGAFFLALNQYRYGGDTPAWWVLVGMGLFIVAAYTDALDGQLARRWNVESAFGRIMDPLCDKVLVLGAFIYLAGPRFVIPEAAAAGGFFNMISGVYPWMVVVILARELLVTSIRAHLEGGGVKFGANAWGKLKMILQAVVVPIVLLIVYLDPQREGLAWLGVVRDVLVYLTVAVTVASGVPYVTGAVRQMRPRDGG